jgi:hypothetical protein
MQDLLGDYMKKIKEMLNRFGILVIRAIWPTKGKGGIQKLGLVVLALSALLGVTQASSIGKLLLGKTAGTSDAPAKVATQTDSPKLSSTNASAVSTSVADDAAQTTVGGTTEAGPANIVDLIADSETIVSGAVKEVTDGFENGVPYTQVTISVNETLRGQVGDEYTFRQFGLTKPRSMGNGKVYIGTTPEGWSKYEVGEDAMFFLYKPASVTGLQTTTGLGQGKVNFKGGNAVSQAGNEGLFEDVEANAGLLNDRDKRLLATKRGAVNAEGFKSFVRRAVSGKWVEGGKLRHAKK